MKHRKAIGLMAVGVAGIGSCGGAGLAAPPEKPVTATVTPSRQIVSGVVSINDVTRNDTQSKATVQLAKNGQALLPIVISAKASESTKAVAAELAEYLKRISGATFEVKTGDGTEGIVLGSMADFPTPALAEALKLYGRHDGREAYAIRVREKKVLLLGATDIGVNHAAFRLLYTLGYRHFFPHEAWEVVPSIPDLKWDRNITNRPQMLNRTVWFQAGSGTQKANEAYGLWARHNLWGISLPTNIGNGGMYGAFSGEIMDAHPEYAAARIQPDGTLKRVRETWQVELANPAVRKLIVDNALKYLRENPTAEMANLEPADSTGHSQSPESLAMGSVSDRVFGMANEVAKAVEKEFPGQGKMVGLLAYNEHGDPPTFKLQPNVHVQMASIVTNSKYTQQERYKAWNAVSNNLGVYEYYSVWAWTHDALVAGYINGVHSHQAHIRDELIGNNVVTMNAEATSSWGSLGRGYYVAQKLMWDPNLDLDGLLNDFYTKAFGPGAAAMKEYFELYDPDNGPRMSADLLGRMFRALDTATKVAKDRPDVIARLDQLKLYMRFVDLIFFRDTQGGRLEGDPIMSNLYRTREYALTSWSMISQAWGGGRDSDAPYTHEEVEKDFQEGLKRYLPSIRDVGTPLKYSNDLVPVVFPDTKPEQNVRVHHGYQGSRTYAFYSFKREPLEFVTGSGDAWGNLTSFTITDAEGHVIKATGTLPAKVDIPHKIEVPKAGVYYLNFSDGGAYWEFKAEPGAFATIVMLNGTQGGRMTMFGEVYLYVPKGTKKVTYFNDGGGHNLLGPDGSDQGRIGGNDFADVPVPAGMDGKLWKLKDVNGKIYFYSVPPYVAPSPAALLIPREVAEKDGLKIRN